MIDRFNLDLLYISRPAKAALRYRTFAGGLLSSVAPFEFVRHFDVYSFEVLCQLDTGS